MKPRTAPLYETNQAPNKVAQRIPAKAMPRLMMMDALVERVHESEAFSFDGAAARIEAAMRRVRARD